MKVCLPVFFLILLLGCTDDKSNKMTVKNSVKKDTTIIKAVNQNPYASIDLSPVDISYFPNDYPIQNMTRKLQTPPVARVIYSRPQKQGRKIFGDLLKYGEPWRLGANEATEIEFFQPVSIQNKKIPKGRFIIYCIPNEKEWSVILNSNVFSWGLKPNPEQDVYKFIIPIERTNTSVEHFTMVFEKSFDGGANLIITWDDALARLPIKF